MAKISEFVIVRISEKGAVEIEGGFSLPSAAASVAASESFLCGLGLNPTLDVWARCPETGQLREFEYDDDNEPVIVQ